MVSVVGAGDRRRSLAAARPDLLATPPRRRVARGLSRSPRHAGDRVPRLRPFRFEYSADAALSVRVARLRSVGARDALAAPRSRRRDAGAVPVVRRAARWPLRGASVRGTARNFATAVLLQPHRTAVRTDAASGVCRARRVPTACRAPRRRGACALCCMRYARVVAASGGCSVRRRTLRSIGVGGAAGPVRCDALGQAPATRRSGTRGGRADDGSALATAAGAPGVAKPQERHRSAARGYVDRRLVRLVRHGVDDRFTDLQRFLHRRRFGRVASLARGGIDARRPRPVRAHDRRDAPGLDPQSAHARALPAADPPAAPAVDRVWRGTSRSGSERRRCWAARDASARRRLRRGSRSATASGARDHHTAFARSDASQRQQPARALSIRFPPDT